MIRITDDSIFQEVEKKSEELSKHSEALSSQLDQNKQLINMFNSTIEKLRTEVSSKVSGEEALITQIQSHLNTIKVLESELEEKQNMVSALNNNLNDIRYKVTSDFEKQLHALENKVEEKIKMILSMKEQIDKKNLFAVTLNQKIEGLTVRIRKEESLLLKLKNDNLELIKTSEETKKENLRLKNSLKASHERVKVTENVNKNILTRLMKSEYSSKNLMREIDTIKKNGEHKMLASENAARQLVKDSKDKLRFNIEENSRVQVTLRAENEHLKRLLEEQRLLIAEKEKREKEFIAEFNTRFGELMKLKTMSQGAVFQPQVPAQKKQSVNIVEPSKTEESHTPIKIERKKPVPVIKNRGPVVGFPKSKNKSTCTIPHGLDGADMSILEPLVERAFESGETKEQIRDSMLQSGYPKDAIDKTFSDLKIDIEPEI